MEQKQIIVALACVVRENEILLTKRREKAQPDIDGMWELPGGKVEFSESPLMTAVREVKEETGHEVVDPVGLPFPYTVMRQYENHILHVIIFCFECKLVSSKLSNFRHAKGKVAAVQWCDIKNINFVDIAPGSREFISWVLEKPAHGKAIAHAHP
jgi:8-oxo-dGTP pyrophosphatase MutT (NUDIX family)